MVSKKGLGPILSMPFCVPSAGVKKNHNTLIDMFIKHNRALDEQEKLAKIFWWIVCGKPQTLPLMVGANYHDNILLLVIRIISMATEAQF